MDRAGALAFLNGRILCAYSAHTLRALRASAPIRIALPYIEPMLAVNVEKEIRKDALVLRRAALAAQAHQAPVAANAGELFLASKTIDEEFLSRTGSMPVRIVIHYEEIEPLRTRRIRYLLEAAYRVLSAWQRPLRLREALRAAYTRADFEMMMCLILDLYAREARALSRTVEVPAVLAPVRERAAKYLATVMSEAAMKLSEELARGLYRA